MARSLTTRQVEVMSILKAVHPEFLTTQEVSLQRTGSRYDAQQSYNTLRQLEQRGMVAAFRHPDSAVAWAYVPQETP